jgi:hypothetical protein
MTIGGVEPPLRSPSIEATMKPTPESAARLSAVFDLDWQRTSMSSTKTEAGDSIKIETKPVKKIDASRSTTSALHTETKPEIDQLVADCLTATQSSTTVVPHVRKEHKSARASTTSVTAASTQRVSSQARLSTSQSSTPRKHHTQPSTTKIIPLSPPSESAHEYVSADPRLGVDYGGVVVLELIVPRFAATAQAHSGGTSDTTTASASPGGGCAPNNSLNRSTSSIGDEASTPTCLSLSSSSHFDIFGSSADDAFSPSAAAAKSTQALKDRIKALDSSMSSLEQNKKNMMSSMDYTKFTVKRRTSLGEYIGCLKVSI